MDYHKWIIHQWLSGFFWLYLRCLGTLGALIKHLLRIFFLIPCSDLIWRFSLCITCNPELLFPITCSYLFPITCVPCLVRQHILCEHSEEDCKWRSALWELTFLKSALSLSSYLTDGREGIWICPGGDTPPELDSLTAPSDASRECEWYLTFLLSLLAPWQWHGCFYLTGQLIDYLLCAVE